MLKGIYLEGGGERKKKIVNRETLKNIVKDSKQKLHKILIFLLFSCTFFLTKSQLPKITLACQDTS